MGHPLISVGVPAWRGAAFVAETLESILRQREVRLRLFISVDGADAATERVCRSFVADPRVRLQVQPERIGWVRNTAAVLAEAMEARADYACIQPHDDLLAEDYLAALMEMAERSPAAAVVFSDIEAFGTESMVICQSSVTGSPLGRQIALLLDHYNAVAFRGLTRVSALGCVPPMSGNSHDDFAADTLWMSRLAVAGELIRVPRVLYRKRYHPDNTHGSWCAWPIERKIAAWTQHCLDMLAEALKVGHDPTCRRLIWEAARARLLHLATPAGPYQADFAAITSDQRRRMLSAFETAAARRPDIGVPDPTPNDFVRRVLRKLKH
jgi:glycosyltransferase involved in cell wall biosynthesis